jgi:hypothetical protein
MHTLGLHIITAYYLHQALIMEIVSSSETSVKKNQIARRNIPEYSHLHTRRRENLKSSRV